MHFIVSAVGRRNSRRVSFMRAPSPDRATTGRLPKVFLKVKLRSLKFRKTAKIMMRYWRRIVTAARGRLLRIHAAADVDVVRLQPGDGGVPSFRSSRSIM